MSRKLKIKKKKQQREDDLKLREHWNCEKQLFGAIIFMILKLHFRNYCLYYILIFGVFSTYCLKNSVKDCFKDYLGKGLHALLLTFAYIGIIRAI